MENPDYSRKPDNLQVMYDELYLLFSSTEKLVKTQERLIENYKEEVSILESIVNTVKTMNDVLVKIAEESGDIVDDKYKHSQ